jgi:hypothetical protein
MKTRKDFLRYIAQSTLTRGSVWKPSQFAVMLNQIWI